MTELTPDDADVPGYPRPFHTHPYIADDDRLGGAGHVHRGGLGPHWHEPVSAGRLLAEHGHLAAALDRIDPPEPRARRWARLFWREFSTWLAWTLLAALVAGLLLSIADAENPWLRVVAAVALVATLGAAIVRLARED